MLKRFLSIFLVFSIFICCSINFCSAQGFDKNCYNEKFYDCSATSNIHPCGNITSNMVTYFVTRNFLETQCTESGFEKFIRWVKGIFGFSKDTLLPCLSAALPVAGDIASIYYTGKPLNLKLPETSKQSGKLRAEYFGHEVCKTLLAESDSFGKSGLVFNLNLKNLESSKAIYSTLFGIKKAEC